MKRFSDNKVIGDFNNEKVLVNIVNVITLMSKLTKPTGHSTNGDQLSSQE